MGKSGNRYCSWLSKADLAVCVGAGPRASWLYQGTPLRCSIPKSATGDVQSARNSDEEFADKAESTGTGSTRAWWPCPLGVSGDEQEFVSMVETVSGWERWVGLVWRREGWARSKKIWFPVKR